MKKFFCKAASVGAICMAMSQITMAQPAVPPVPPTSKIEMKKKGNQSEIIIRQKGDKDTKLTLEIKNGEYFINGKPLEKFDDQNVIVEKIDRDDIIVNVPDIAYSPSPFRINPWNDDRLEREQLSKEDMARRIQKSVQIRMNSAFLGVSSRKTEK